METGEPCTECDKVRIEQTLTAEEAARASARELVKLEKQDQLTLAQLKEGKRLDSEEAQLAHTRELDTLQKQHEHALDASEDAAVTAIQQARLEADAELGKLFHQTLTDVAKGSVDRSRDSAKYVQTAAAAIAALYTAVLGLVFSVTDNPLPVRGVAAAVFLGLSVALATAYLAYLTKPNPPPMYAGGGSLGELQLNRTAFVTNWINAIVNDRRWAIRASVLSLAIGVAFVPAAFVATHRAPAVPAAPTAPTIPAQVAPGLAEDAAKAFSAEVESYGAAVNARNTAIEAAASAAKTADSDERNANWATLFAGILGLLVVFLGPFAARKD